MSSNLTLYRVLVKLGADESTAEQAAQLDTAALATKADLNTAVAELKADLIKWYVITTFGLLGAMSLINGLLLRFGSAGR